MLHVNEIQCVALDRKCPQILVNFDNREQWQQFIVLDSINIRSTGTNNKVLRRQRGCQQAKDWTSRYPCKGKKDCPAKRLYEVQSYRRRYGVASNTKSMISGLAWKYFPCKATEFVLTVVHSSNHTTSIGIVEMSIYQSGPSVGKRFRSSSFAKSVHRVVENGKRHSKSKIVHTIVYRVVVGSRVHSVYRHFW